MTHRLRFGRRRLGLALAALLAASPAWAQGCEGPPLQREATSQQIGEYVRASGKRVLSFVGYSGAGYEDAAAMRAAARQALQRHDPAQWLVNIGGTAVGIGEVYELAKAAGFVTLGIVSTRARDGGDALSPCVDQVFFVRDARWGGRMPGSTRLAPTSAALVAHSSEFVGIGGGEVARDELAAARAAGKPVHFAAADMNHRIEPSDFRGAASALFAPRP
jgi:hypothetical protein